MASVTATADDPFAPLEGIPAEGWLAMMEADAELISTKLKSPYLLDVKTRAELVETAKRLVLASWWCRSYTESVLKCASHVLTK